VGEGMFELRSFFKCVLAYCEVNLSFYDNLFVSLLVPDKNSVKQADSVFDYLRYLIDEKIIFYKHLSINICNEAGGMNLEYMSFIVDNPQDNACSVWIYFHNRYNTTKTIIPTTTSSFIASCDMFIDRLHQKTHTRPMCKTDRNIAKRSDMNNVNTVICEQTKSWLKQYLNMLCNFSGERSKYYYLFLFHLFNCKRCMIDPLCQGLF